MYTKQSSDKIQGAQISALSIKTGYLDDDFRIFSFVSEEEGEFQPLPQLSKLLFLNPETSVTTLKEKRTSFSQLTLYLCRLGEVHRPVIQ